MARISDSMSLHFSSRCPLSVAIASHRVSRSFFSVSAVSRSSLRRLFSSSASRCLASRRSLSEFNSSCRSSSRSLSASSAAGRSSKVHLDGVQLAERRFWRRSLSDARADMSAALRRQRFVASASICRTSALPRRTTFARLNAHEAAHRGAHPASAAICVLRAPGNLRDRNEAGDGRLSFRDQHGLARLHPTKVASSELATQAREIGGRPHVCRHSNTTVPSVSLRLNGLAHQINGARPLRQPPCPWLGRSRYAPARGKVRHGLDNPQRSSRMAQPCFGVLLLAKPLHCDAELFLDDRRVPKQTSLGWDHQTSDHVVRLGNPFLNFQTDFNGLGEIMLSVTFTQWVDREIAHCASTDREGLPALWSTMSPLVRARNRTAAEQRLDLLSQLTLSV